MCIPAGGSANFQTWNNDFESNKKGESQGDSVVSIEVTVTKIKSSDENWGPTSFKTSGPTVGVVAPPAK